MAGDGEGAALYDFLLERASVPFFDMLHAWIYRGVLDDVYEEFAVRESTDASGAPTPTKEELGTDFSCEYWARRFTLVAELVPAFLEPHAAPLLDCGKYLHVVRECGRELENPLAARPPLRCTTDWRELGAAIGAACDWASAQVLRLLMGEQRLMATVLRRRSMPPNHCADGPPTTPLRRRGARAAGAGPW